VERVMKEELLKYLEENVEDSIIYLICQIGDDDEDLLKIHQFFKSYVKRGKLYSTEYAVIGEALCMAAQRNFEAKCLGDI